MKKDCRFLSWPTLLLGTMVFLFVQSTAFAALTVTFEDGSSTEAADTEIEGFMSNTADPTGVFLDPAQSVFFKGTDSGGQQLIYRYKLDFGETTSISQILIEGAAFCDGTLKLLDASDAVISQKSINAGNVMSSFVMNVASNSGQVFYLEEYDTCPGWRYRSKIKIILEGDPEYLQPEWWFVQKRVYETGERYNRIYFAMLDGDGNYISSDVNQSITVYDPDGDAIFIDEITFSNWKTLGGGYNENNGAWQYSGAFDDIGTYYRLSFTDELKTGTYTVIFEDTNGYTYQGDYDYEVPSADIPVISSNSFYAYKDGGGNFIWTWTPPTYVDWGVTTSVRAIFEIMSAGSYAADVSVRVPTHMGYLFVPKSVMDLAEAQGDEIRLLLQLRINNNAVRTYSKSVNWQDVSTPLVKGDIDGDRVVGIAETINALKVVNDR